MTTLELILTFASSFSVVAILFLFASLRKKVSSDKFQTLCRDVDYFERQINGLYRITENLSKISDEHDAKLDNIKVDLQVYYVKYKEFAALLDSLDLEIKETVVQKHTAYKVVVKEEGDD